MKNQVKILKHCPALMQLKARMGHGQDRIMGLGQDRIIGLGQDGIMGPGQDRYSKCVYK